jgi:hypothetical protein
MLCALALGALCALPAGAWAQPAPADSAHARPGERVRAWHAQPWAVMMRSALVPGWGQAANRRPVKALLALGVEGWAGSRLVSSWRDVNAALAREDQAQRAGDAAGAAVARADYDAAFNRRATAGWVLGVAIAASMLDAYVDAHFLQFDADFGPDPTLPETPPRPGDAAPAARVRLGVGLEFRGP